MIYRFYKTNTAKELGIVPEYKSNISRKVKNFRDGAILLLEQLQYRPTELLIMNDAELQVRLEQEHVTQSELENFLSF